MPRWRYHDDTRARPGDVIVLGRMPPWLHRRRRDLAAWRRRWVARLRFIFSRDGVAFLLGWAR